MRPSIRIVTSGHIWWQGIISLLLIVMPKVGITKVGSFNFATNLNEMKLWVQPLSTKMITIRPKIVSHSFTVKIRTVTQNLVERDFHHALIHKGWLTIVAVFFMVDGEFEMGEKRTMPVTRRQSFSALETEPLLTSLLTLTRVSRWSWLCTWRHRGHLMWISICGNYGLCWYIGPWAIVYTYFGLKF